MTLLLLSQIPTAPDSLRRDFVFWSIAVAVVAVGVFLTLWARSLRKSSWKRFANANDLSFTLKNNEPIVSGQLDGRDFELRQLNRSSDRGALGLEEVSMTIKLKAPPTDTFTVASDGRLAQLFHRAIGDDRTVDLPHHEDDAVQDQVTRIDTPDDTADGTADDALAESARSAISELLRAWNHCEVSVSREHLVVTERTSIKSLAALNDRAKALTSAARLLESQDDGKEQTHVESYNAH